ncbi:MAG: SprT-like family protein [Planctomyces sp.]|nr:SprT-like family protein [Planctomyces sp.]
MSHLSSQKAQLLDLVSGKGFTANQFLATSTDIGQSLLSESATCTTEQLERLTVADLEWLFQLYDDRCFHGLCRKLILEAGVELSFRCSRRMTRAGGKTTRRTWSRPRRGQARQEYEITISQFLLEDNFASHSRPISVCGYVCEHRLHALQRIMEHEIVHLIEMLLWDDSSCAARRFRGIASRWFQHREFNHQLITPREKAYVDHGVRPGSLVQFMYEGEPRTGVVNRISKRVTVLVPDPRGERYTDGRRYIKYYVPLASLKRVG